MRKLTIEDIRMLAEIERMMDEGKMPFVMYGSGRAAVRQDVMDELGLKQGQTISDTIFIAIQRQNIAHCETQIALQKAQAAVSAGMREPS